MTGCRCVETSPAQTRSARRASIRKHPGEHLCLQRKNAMQRRDGWEVQQGAYALFSKPLGSLGWKPASGSLQRGDNDPCKANGIVEHYHWPTLAGNTRPTRFMCWVVWTACCSSL